MDNLVAAVDGVGASANLSSSSLAGALSSAGAAASASSSSSLPQQGTAAAASVGGAAGLAIEKINQTTKSGNSNAMMNNGSKDTSNTDVQKLQEQLNDIKEQVHGNECKSCWNLLIIRLKQSWHLFSLLWLTSCQE